MVRPATRDDASQIARILDDFNLEFGDPSPGERFLTSRVTALIADGSKHFLLAWTAIDEAGAGPEGLAQVDFRPTVWSDGPVALLEELYVVPGRRGHGLGRELMDAVLDLARGRGAAMVELATGEDDTAARGLYESAGFRNRVEGEQNAAMLYYELEL
jgi:GNAT superfamily N-acetyltransferase